MRPEVLRNSLFDAVRQLSGTHYRKLFSIVTLLQFYFAKDIPLFQDFLLFANTCLAPAIILSYLDRFSKIFSGRFCS